MTSVQSSVPIDFERSVQYCSHTDVDIPRGYLVQLQYALAQKRGREKRVTPHKMDEKKELLVVFVLMATQRLPI